MENLTDKINRLIRTPKRRSLNDIAPRPAIAAARGQAAYVAPNVDGPAGSVLRREVVTVYSSIIVTEDGAYEKPPSWPSSGTYPGSAFKLDINAPYYEQQRVHLVLYDVGGVMHEDRYLIRVADPFAGEIFQGISNLSGSPWTPTRYMVIAPVSLPSAIGDRIDELTASGVVTV